MAKAKKSGATPRSRPRPPAKAVGGSQPSAAHRRKLFVEAYIANGGNGRQAAISAGFAERGAATTASRLLNRPDVQGELKRRREELEVKAELTTEDVIRNLASAVHADPRRLFHQDGRLKQIHELDDESAMAIQSFEVVANSDGKALFTAKVRLVDRNTARDQAMKHLGLYEKDRAQGAAAVRTLLGMIDGETTGL